VKNGDEVMKKDTVITCKVTGIQAYGVFVEYEDYQGLIHISEVSDWYVADIHKIFAVGDIIDAYILEVDEEKKKLQLSYKKAQKIHPKVAKQVDIKIGFRSINKRMNEWIKEKSEETK
jgi:general stress protein 13